MRMMMKVKIPHEKFNAAVKDGTIGAKMHTILGDMKPEAAYFTEMCGHRGGIFIVDVASPSAVPALAEPWFLTFNADVQFHVVMSPEDLGKSGLDTIGKKWA